MSTLLMRPITAPSAPSGDSAELDEGLFVIDPDHTSVAFAGRTSRIMPTVSARFREVTGSIVLNPRAGTAEIEVRIELGSVTSGNRTWDEMIAIADPFDVRQNPVAYYSGRASGLAQCPLGSARSGQIAINGELSMLGKRRSVPLVATWPGATTGRLAVSAQGVVDRAGFGLRIDVPGLSRLLPQQMTLTIDLEARIQTPDQVSTTPQWFGAATDHF